MSLLLLINGFAFAQKHKAIRVSIYFGGGSYYIDAKQKRNIVKVIKQIKDLSKYQISITSHTDNIGGKEYNEWLSKMRSNAVLKQLIEHQIKKGKVLIKDFGQDNPMYTNDSHNGRIRNRRVDLLFSPLNM
ncbi:fibronectin-binding protein, putative [Microscilla marina ATCC 23134]|uniref:Fibronectin-binding protein, putative n=1 Tax=Microscilla marina ATCC 23134 TaxID=313606 RepID=A1ZPV9_MICM2|nr:fibronectin-binding protein, putative [Microscilla marina ATCC 23134]